MAAPNFQRDVRCLFGLPFDVVGLDAAAEHLRTAARQRKPCFLSTPNLNFVVAAQADAAFRDSVLASDLSVMDGMPLVWTARLLGLPFKQRVAGASLFERLREGDPAAPLKVFFFGGPDGVAQRAAERLNAHPSGLRCVGFDSPGFGPVAQMSEPARIDRINTSGADFVVVSLGAKKGQAWIERNRAALTAPVVSHLGAVVNFVAGSVRRAPPWLQRIGLEWAWRVLEEPALWRRYVVDGCAFLSLVLRQAVPLALLARLAAPTPAQLDAATVQCDVGESGSTLRLQGAWAHTNSAVLREALGRIANGNGVVCLEIGELRYADSAVIALLLLLWGHCTRGERGWQVQVPRQRSARQILRFNGAACLLQAVAPATKSGPGRSVEQHTQVDAGVDPVASTLSGHAGRHGTRRRLPRRR